MIDPGDLLECLPRSGSSHAMQPGSSTVECAKANCLADKDRFPTPPPTL